MKLGPKNGYSYEAGSDKLKSPKLPGGEMVISDLIIQYYQVNAKADVTDPVTRATTIQNYLQSPAFPCRPRKTSPPSRRRNRLRPRWRHPARPGRRP